MESHKPANSFFNTIRRYIGWLALILLVGPLVVAIFRQITGLDPTPRVEIAPVWINGWNIASLIVFPILVILVATNSNASARQRTGIGIFFGFATLIHVIIFASIQF